MMETKIFILVFLVTVGQLASAQVKCPTNKKVIKCYWTNWSIYRPDEGKHEVNFIIPEYCTHLVYAFAGLNLDDQMDSLDYSSDITAGNYNKFIALKETNPCLKYLLAIGGWSEGSEKYSVVFEDPISRSKFVRGVLRFLVYYGFDGIDLDWEYPGTRGGISTDKENLVNLTSELKEMLSPRNRIITMAIPSILSIVKNGYDIERICENVELLSVMGYDLNYPDKASAHSPLKRESTEPTSRETIDDVVQYLIKNNCPKNKIILGIPAYGRSYTLKLTANNAINAQVTGLGNPGKYSRTKGFVGYNEICENLSHGNWTVKYLQNNAVKYAYSGTQWVSYDDPDTVKQKAEYVNKENLGGMMFWSVDTDDFHGDCHSESYPLLVAANKAFGNKLSIISSMK